MDGERYASALKYNLTEDSAPKLIAKGRGYMADRIVEKAEEAGISVYRDEKLARQLQNLELGVEIPRELYEVVAEVLIFVAEADRKFR